MASEQQSPQAAPQGGAQQPQSENVASAPADVPCWTSERGWIRIPASSVGHGPARGWNGARGWFRYTPGTPENGRASRDTSWEIPEEAEAASDPWAGAEPTGQWVDYSAEDPWGGWRGSRTWTQHDGRDSDNKKDKDGDVPEWDGKTTHRNVYFRKIDIWVATTGVSPEKQALRLLQKLTGEAFEKLDNVTMAELRVPDGVDIFKKKIIDAYEPIEDYRVGKIMDEFLYKFERKSGEEVVDFNRSWAKELKKAEDVAGELTPKWKAHLYMTKLKLSTTQRTQILTATLGVFTTEAIQKAALTVFPNLKDYNSLGHKGHKGFHAKGDKKHGFKKKGFHKKGFRKKSWRTHEVDQDEDDEEEEPSEGDSESESESGSDEESEAEEEEQKEDQDEYEDLPPELEEAKKEADIYFSRAKKQRAEIEKARGFFKKGASQSSRDDATKSLKGKLPCSKCGQLGHWHKDKVVLSSMSLSRIRRSQERRLTRITW